MDIEPIIKNLNFHGQPTCFIEIIRHYINTRSHGRSTHKFPWTFPHTSDRTIWFISSYLLELYPCYKCPLNEAVDLL